MKCPNCNKEIPVDYFDDTPGAVFITKGSGGGKEYIDIWPAVCGLKKYEGCIEFGRGVDDCPASDTNKKNYMVLNNNQCDEIYFDYPEAGEAWLVKPTKDGYDWTPVDNQIVFSHIEE